MPFRPRRGNYIRERNGAYYYRRSIPKKYQGYFDHAVEWVIELKGRTKTERELEAKALAHAHNMQIRGWDEHGSKALKDATYWDDKDSEPPQIYLGEGKTSSIYDWAISNTPDGIREASQAGLLAMTPLQAEARFAVGKALAAFEADPSELNELRLFKARKALEEALSAGIGETAVSILDQWHAREKQKPTTWKKHKQYVSEFSEFHNGLALTQYTKRHVIDFVEHVQKSKKPDGDAYSPTSITKRLDSVRAMFSYAESADLIEHNPASGVKAPKDPRPKSARSWKSLEREEIENLVATATKLWSSRRASRNKDRKNDLITALHCLIWTAARPEEICQLRRSDLDIARGAIVITNDESDDDARERMVKNENSTRIVPIHTRLLPILEAHSLRSNHPLLFPSFEPQPTRKELAEAKQSGDPVVIKGRYARPISREWTDYLRHKIAPNDPRKVLYSLRHSWAVESRKTGMPEFVRNAIMGHINENPHADRYGGDDPWLEEKRLHLEKMDCFTAIN